MPRSAARSMAVVVAAALAACVNKPWGALTAPVFGTSESGVYAGAELFAGPNKFDGNYFSGVLPNGRIVKPVGTSVQVGMNPLGAALTPDGRFLVTSNDDERDGGMASLQSPKNVGGYSLTVLDTSTMTVVSDVHTAGRYFVGLAATGAGPYTLYASGGPDHSVKAFSIDVSGVISSAPIVTIKVPVITSATDGHVSHYVPDATAFNPVTGKPPVPSGFSRSSPVALSFPAGLALSGKYLYVACNGDNSLAAIDTTTQTVVKQLGVGFFPYGVAVSGDGATVFVTNWGISDYTFKAPGYAGGLLTSLGTTGANQPDGFYVPVTDTTPARPRTSSAWIISVPGGDPTAAAVVGARYLGKPLDATTQVGDTHPSAAVVVGTGPSATLYVARSNDDSLAIVSADGSTSTEFDLSLKLEASFGDPAVRLRGTYPNALAASPDGRRLYVAEAGINSVAVLDIRSPRAPTLLGRIPTGWYPTALAVSPDGKTLYVVNAKGIGEDVNPKAALGGADDATGIESFTDGNYVFGTVQKVDVSHAEFDAATVLSYNFAAHPNVDTSVVPLGGGRSPRIKHVIFILHENKTFDSMLGSASAHFGPFADTAFVNADGSPNVNPPPPAQFNSVAVNTQALATAFATAVNYYSDSEESDAGHQFAASGTATDYTEKTLLVKSGRGLLVNKNFEPEDYPASGYIFNNAARNGISFKDYGALIRIAGTDTGTSTPTSLNDPTGAGAGYPSNNTSAGPADVGDTTSSTSGLGQSYFLQLPVLAVLGGKNANGEDRIDRNYPGYNFNISDQRRALEFIADFDRMVAAGTVPDFLYVYQPNDHTGSQQATNVAAATPAQQVADGDVALAMVVEHIMKSPIYYDAATNTGAAIFITYDDAQSTLDHIHEHRTPLVVVSPFAKPGYIAKRHYSTASVVKTEELLLGLPPNNLGDLLATDLREMFQPTYNGITAALVPWNVAVSYRASPEGRRIWKLASRLDLSGPDRDSRRLGALARLSMEADRLAAARHEGRLGTRQLQQQHAKILAAARRLVALRPRADD